MKSKKRKYNKTGKYSKVLKTPDYSENGKPAEWDITKVAIRQPSGRVIKFFTPNKLRGKHEDLSKK